jgi:putative flippase GtrA
MAVLSSLSEERRRTLGQILRFGVTGGALTVAQAGGYWLLATPLGIDPALSFTLMYVVMTGIGFVVHGAVSFKGHGSRDRPGVRSARFLLVNMVGFALNQGFIWLFVTHMGGPTWWPIVPMVFVSPIVTFVLHRFWTYA